MPETIVDPRDGLTIGARKLLDRAAGADARGARALVAAIDDVFLPADARLDDRTRAALAILLSGLTATVEGEIREHGAKLLTQRGEGALAALLTSDAPPAIERLAGAGLLRDPDFLGECLARVRLELLARAIPAQAPDHPDVPSLIVRLVRSPDRVVAIAAQAVLAGESHRRAAQDGGALAGTGLPAELHQRLVWWVAAAIRERHLSTAVDRAGALDRALAEAAMRNLAAHDEGERLEGATMRLAVAIDARPDELPTLLVDAMRDRRVAVFTALLATALGIAFAPARDIVLDPDGDRLWLVLRALDMPRETVAEIGYLLCEADPRRDLEDFADTLDSITSIDPDIARGAIAPLRLPSDFRAAVVALDSTRTRR